MAGPVDLILLRGLLPDLPVRPGAVLHARVVDPRTILLEGVRLRAQLPEGAQPGSVLRVRVQESSPERLHLRIIDAPEPAPASPSAPVTPEAAYALALPGGVQARLLVERREESAPNGQRGAASSVVVRYDSPTLGRLDVRVAVGEAAVHVSAGEPAERVRSAAGVLAQALERATGRPSLVTVHPRLESIDASA